MNSVPHGQGPAPLPAQFDSYIKAHVKLTPEQQKQLLAGQPVTQLLESDPAKEVAIFGAVWVSAPLARYVDAVKNIEEFEKGDNFLVTKRISSPPRLEDFDRLTLPPEDVADLRACKVVMRVEAGRGGAGAHSEGRPTGRSRPRRPT